MNRAASVTGGLTMSAFALPTLGDAGALYTPCTECAAQLKLPPPACQCIVDGASGLDDNQQAFIAASLTKDEAKTTTLGWQMTVTELTQAATFIATSPQACMQAG